MTEAEKQRLIELQLNKSAECFEIAEEMQQAHPTFSVNRYYYALYDSLSALTLSINEEARMHKGTIATFNRRFDKKDIFTRDDGKLVARVFLWRTKATMTTIRSTRMRKSIPFDNPYATCWPKSENTLSLIATGLIPCIAPATPPLAK
ncbi:hypothetical protein [Neolewinella litorea]|uniref:HEPN domain-containing protein n=1 Tax=Neolewinella litorea TaxID=2562452 RepID=A0A4S4ND06_9BACT|nr:hypothetical protein [Neolewinella litorea]THH36397.1 hypothetical protein E4021_15030 [Neolewinella litorea]